MSTRIDRADAASGPVVTGFIGRGFKVGDEVYASGIRLTPEVASAWPGPASGALQLHDIDDLVSLAPTPEFLLLGTGATLVRPPRFLVAALEERGIGVEAMDSRAAARAWAVLRAEDRWIVAALMPL